MYEFMIILIAKHDISTTLSVVLVVSYFDSLFGDFRISISTLTSAVTTDSVIIITYSTLIPRAHLPHSS
jgi:hypothetical protein